MPKLSCWYSLELLCSASKQCIKAYLVGTKQCIKAYLVGTKQCIKAYLVGTKQCIKTYLVDTHWNCPSEAIPMSTHKICFRAKITKIITKTRLYNFDPLKPHFYIVKLGFTGVYIIFLISVQKQRLWVLVRTTSLRQF